MRTAAIAVLVILASPLFLRQVYGDRGAIKSLHGGSQLLWIGMVTRYMMPSGWQ